MKKKILCFIMCLILLFSNAGITFASNSDILYPDGTSADNTRLDMDDAWKYATGKGVNVAIIDGGANLYDPQLTSRIKGVYNAKTGSTRWEDVHSTSESHGTNCAKNLLKVAPNVNLYIIKAGGGSYIYTDQVIKGLEWAKSKKCRVVSLSFGGDNFVQKEYDAIQSLYAGSPSALVCASAGNSGKNEPHYPASFTNTLSVGAATYNSSQKKYVVIPKGTYNNQIDVVAPGSTTSAAAPFAAGVAALLFQAKPSLTASECRNLLRSTALDLGTKGKDPHYGYGLIQPYKAIKKLLNITPPAQSIHLSHKSGTMYVGDSKKLSYKLTPSSSKEKVTWSSSNTKIAAVNSSGVVTAKASGSVTITAKTASGKKASCKVAVRPSWVPGKIIYYKSDGKLTVSWDKDTTVSGYQVQIAANSTFTNNLTQKTISSNLSTGYTFKNLKKSSRYYVRIRSYKKVNSKTTYYSPWSSGSVSGNT